MRTISVRIEFDSLVEDGSYDAVETCRLNFIFIFIFLDLRINN